MNFFSQKNRILLKELIKTDFKLRYQGSFIGYLWSILKPLMMFTIMYLVFVRFLRFDDGTPHYAVGLLLAMIFWGFFTEATNMGMLSIVSRGDLLRKLNFPKQTIVISSVLGAAINFLINLVVVFVFALINHVPIGFNTLVIIPLFIEVLLMAMGVAFILSDSLLNTVILVLSGKLCFKLVCMRAQLSIPSLTFFKETRRLLQRL